MKKLCVSISLMLASIAILGTGPVLAGQAAPQPATSMVAAAPPPSAPAGCGQVSDLAGILSTKGEVCTAGKPKSAVPEFLARPTFGRTCRCSCGAPCKTDADCGPGGICGAGITCC